MKITVDIADDLARQARELAKRRDTTLRAILEEGIRKVLAAEGTGEAYELPDRSVRGHGLQAAFRDRTRAESHEAALRRLPRLIAVDTNILVYAHRADSEWHVPARDSIRSPAQG